MPNAVKPSLGTQHSVTNSSFSSNNRFQSSGSRDNLGTDGVIVCSRFLELIAFNLEHQEKLVGTDFAGKEFTSHRIIFLSFSFLGLSLVFIFGSEIY